VVSDSGHYIHVDRPDLVTRLVRDIAARLAG
jgi:pimeloyl-ACP methyl ester carboxylesterase